MGGTRRVPPTIPGKAPPIRALNITRWIAAAILTVLLVVPAWYVYAGSRTIVTVDGGSMAPTLEPGDVVVISPIAGQQLRAGMVVTARDQSNLYYTHRIEKIDADGGLHLKGDANATADLETRYPDQVLGAVDVVLRQPWGTILVQLQHWPLRICVLVTIFGLAFLPLDSRRPSGTTRNAPPATRITASAEVPLP